MLRCALNEEEASWVPRALVLAYEPGARSAIVADEVGLYFSGTAAMARITTQNSRVLRFNWKVEKVSDSRGNLVPAMVYRASLARRNGKLSVSAEPLGYSTRFSGRGRCAPVSDAERRAFEELVRSAG